MEQILQKMDPEKRKQLIHAAMKEFGQNRFNIASTNNIVKEAGISKGLLYHYFPSKQALYDELRAFVIKLLSEAITSGVNWNNGDPIERLQEIAIIKMRLFNEYPYMVSFSKMMYENMSYEEIKKMIDSYIPNIYTRIYTENIDYSLFKEGTDIQKTLKFLQYFLDHFSEEKLPMVMSNDSHIDADSLKEEMDQYLSLFKQTFYKSSKQEETQ